jgi:putative ATPase
LDTEPFSGVPLYLRSTAYRGAKKMGHGIGYKYPHDYPGHHVAQQYLPDSLKDKIYYEPSDSGREAGYKEKLARLRKK